MRALFDTNILIDYLNGIEQAREEIALFPDAIIYASATVHRATLVTRNTKDFPKTMPGVRVPYELSSAP